MRKIIKIIGLCFITIIIVISISMMIPSKTIDFRGKVTKIEIIEDNTVFYISVAEASYIVIADNKTNVSYCCEDDPDIDLSDINVGDTIEGNYRWLSKENMAKFIIVEYHNIK